MSLALREASARCATQGILFLPAAGPKKFATSDVLCTVVQENGFADTNTHPHAAAAADILMIVLFKLTQSSLGHSWAEQGAAAL